jgi:transcriptional regulator with XRE-family HTH domain
VTTSSSDSTRVTGAPTDTETDLGIDETLARNIRAEREYLGLSQEDVAAVLGVPRPAISSIENGRRKVSSAELAKLATLFGTSSDRLMGAVRDEEPSVAALFRTAKALTEHDRAQVLRFAEFLREAGSPPAISAPGSPDNAQDGTT